eukprot:CAMPEP_0172162926 /NCGR_PEP_ID=MMETSP1050-20130122/6975_1 /TAXON_ID=233186 /ORGANISM="Cryptomonas curvata, Strain CCAP979/52" /LENGTH=67 /DNA_ID=CAMNT_0012833035 /DNA_START=135 /DNA_END=341 /DNA_ORIENTATION=+
MFGFAPGQMLAAQAPDWQFQRSYGWLPKTNDIGSGDFETNPAANGYDWYYHGPPSWVPNYSTWVANN